MLAERAALRRQAFTHAQRVRLSEIKAAFAEGHVAGVDWIDPNEAWARSKARRAIQSPTRIRGLMHEWKLRPGATYDEGYAWHWHRRRMEIADAFAEGHAIGAFGLSLRKGWLYSDIRRSLYYGPKTPLHLRREPYSRSREPA